MRQGQRANFVLLGLFFVLLVCCAVLAFIFRVGVPYSLEMTDYHKVILSLSDDARSRYDLVAQVDSANFARAIFIVTLIQLVIAVVGTYFLIQTVILSREATDAAVSAAAAAQRSAEISADTARRELRAYLTIKFESLLNYAPDQPMRARINVQNVGSTPALSVTGAARLDLISLADDTNVREFVESFELRADDRAIHPGSGFALVSALPLTLNMADFGAHQQGGNLVRLCGRVDYRDIYDGLHTSYFHYVFRHGGSVRNLTLGRFGNSAT